jgi:hypothetical protein
MTLAWRNHASHASSLKMLRDNLVVASGPNNGNMELEIPSLKSERRHGTSVVAGRILWSAIRVERTAPTLQAALDHFAAGH